MQRTVVVEKHFSGLELAGGITEVFLPDTEGERGKTSSLPPPSPLFLFFLSRGELSYDDQVRRRTSMYLEETNITHR